MEKKQSSIEWLENQLKERYSLMNSEPLFEQAKAMHKEEVNMVSCDWWNEGTSYMYDGERKYNSFDDYYNETFGGDNE